MVGLTNRMQPRIHWSSETSQDSGRSCLGRCKSPRHWALHYHMADDFQGNETDWKIMGIDIKDPLAPLLNCMCFRVDLIGIS